MNLDRAWNGIRVVLREEFSFYDIKELVGLAGVEVTRLAHLVQRRGGGSTKGELMTALDREISGLVPETKRTVMRRIADAIVLQSPGASERLEAYLRPLGWSFVEGKLLSVAVFDVHDLATLPEASHQDLTKAAARFREGDLSGALAAACGAVDSAVQAVLDESHLSEHNVTDSRRRTSFQARYKRALQAKKAVENVEAELRTLGWDQSEARRVAKNMEASLNHGAFVMQSLRSRMSDVHGTKGVVSTLVFDSMKWAGLMVAALK